MIWLGKRPGAARCRGRPGPTTDPPTFPGGRPFAARRRPPGSTRPGYFPIRAALFRSFSGNRNSSPSCPTTLVLTLDLLGRDRALQSAVPGRALPPRGRR